MISKWREIFAVMLMGLALVLLGWSYWPVPMIQAETLLYPERVTGPTGIKLLSNAVRATVQWPRWIRFGESAQVHVSLSAADETAREIFSSVSLESQSLSLESKLDIFGARLSPLGNISLPTQTTLPARFTWIVVPLSRDSMDGILWLYLRLNENEIPLVAQKVTIKVRTLGGLQQNELLWAGWGGLVLGVVLLFPNIERRIFGRLA